MPKQVVKSLISDLHDRFADDLTSDAQKTLMEKLQTHIHEMNEAEPIDPSFVETVEVLLNDIETEHPTAASVLRQVMDVFKNIGI